MNRRFFIRRAAVGGGLLVLPQLATAAASVRSTRQLTILHTNDWHSQIDPFPDNGGRNANQGGVLRRASLIRQIRREQPNVLLFDSGDIFQGTPYFNFFLGELEMKLMSQMGYDAGTIGNHDFDGGIENLATQLGHATFPLLSANYDFTNTVLADRIEPYRVFERGGVRVGVFGLGIELKGLVPEELYGNTNYQNPLDRGNETARHLRTRLKCDLVVCLSHLGYRYRNEKVDDVKLARASRHIDLILGGHTHTFMDQPAEVPNAEGLPVVINQVGFAGLRLGRLDVTFGSKGERACVSCTNLRV
ncbi:bifunctional metallophosphatase/5'-nucleotidase [Neolewinella litorea]|uniref:Bifunctional metallophosphatase/5'-nucleotidase n=1 Tax=Neolewinella litorea TaxID=2562452 RepID=A0A4S4NNE3_9BACT|nr:metallophosphatase [Neolewinella litorea]THH41509.1 bifunctional metallophosphatase/5'-nucleotidase [Neolewinella litorea]